MTRRFNGTNVQLLTNARSEKVNRLVSGNATNQELAPLGGSNLITNLRWGRARLIIGPAISDLESLSVSESEREM